MTISRRGVLAASASAPLIMATGPARAATASIQIHSRRHRGEIDKKIFGNFIEHLGRCITGGIFDEGSPLSDKEGFRKDVMAAVKDMDVPFLRWPGGNFSSNYNWTRRHRAARQAPAAAGDGLGHGGGQPLRHP